MTSNEPDARPVTTASEPDIPPNHFDNALAEAIAIRVRELRIALGMTVAQLADESRISKGMLSKIENGHSSPSLHTLAGIARALKVPVTSLFRGLDEERDALFVPAGTGLQIVREGTRVGHQYQLLGSIRGPHKRMEPLLVTLTDESEVFPLFQHPGTEFIYMLAGKMEYGHGASLHVLRPGDALQFDGQVPHGPTRLIRTPIKFLTVIAYGDQAR